MNYVAKSQSDLLTKRVRLAGIVITYRNGGFMKALVLWLVFVAIDVFKLFIVFVVIFGIASATGALYLKDRCELLYYKGLSMRDFIGSLLIAVISTGLMIAIGLYFYAKPGFDALKTFHFG